MKRRPTGQEGKLPEVPAMVAPPDQKREPEKKELVLAMDVVYLVHLDQQVRPVSQANLVSPERPACLDLPVNHPLHHAKLSLHRHANPAHQVHLVHLVPLVHLAIPAIKEHLAAQEPMLHLDHPDHLAHLAHQVQLVPTDHPAMLAPLLKASQLCPANPEMLATLAHPVLQVQQAIQAKTAKLVNQAPKVPKARPDHQVPTVNQVRPVHQAHQVLQEKRVFVRNIALWTAVFSSKTERGDKQRVHSIIDIISKGFFEWTINIGLYLSYIYQFLRRLKFRTKKHTVSSLFVKSERCTFPNASCLPFFIFHACFVIV
jgi:hypothetical protein